MHRVFVLLCVVWALFVLIGFPIKRASQAQEFATYRLNLESPANTQAERDERERRPKAISYEA